jgi:hypothetical protein
MKKAHEHSHHGHTGFTRHSPRNGFTAYIVLSPAIGLVCHRHLRSCPRKLDAGVEASGPHDFAVRISTIRQARFRVHRIPPHVGDVRNAPLPGQDGESRRTDLPDGLSGIFLKMGMDIEQVGRRSDLPVGQN